jgi:hypothetical protein
VLLHAGLDDAQLGPRLARLLAPSSPLPAREMVARGLAPLAGAEPWLALYQLWVRGGPTLAEQASRTAGELPAAAVMTALADPHLPPVVLDFMARRRIRSPETLRLLVHHPRVHDTTLAALARSAPEAVCAAIARNQRRWLGCPAIAEQLVHNPCCDRATAHAVLELGAREAIAGLVELRRRALAGAALQDGPEAHARATAWMLRSAPNDPFPALDAAPPARPASGGLSLRPGPMTPSRDLSFQADTAPARPPRRLLPAPPVPAPVAVDADESEVDEGDELDLPIGDDWDELDVPPPAPRAAVPRPTAPVAPRQLELPRAVLTARPTQAATRSGYAEQVLRVLDPATPLPVAMSLLHRLRAPDLRRVAAAPRLPPALIAAARRRTGAA